MSINVEELKIKISTNLPGSNSSLIDFKRTMLSHPELVDMRQDLSEYPYFTFDVKYPLKNLRYLTYKDRVEFFFNKEKFTQRLLTFSKEKTILDITKIETDKDEQFYYKRRDKNIEKNILAMIELLFPTKFPVINDIQSSYDIVQERSKIKNMVLDPMVTNNYCYFKINNETYTVKKNIWINDILNHPFYQRLILEYRKLWIALEESKLKIKREYNLKIKNKKVTENEIKSEKEKRIGIIDKLLKEKNDSVDKKDVPREYDVFTGIIVNDYKAPLRESSNTELQTLLNTSNSDSIEEFYNFLNYLYDRFFYLGKNENSKKLDMKYKNKLKVGMSFVNLNIMDAPKKEVYIYIDFIKGEVNKENEKKIWCPFVGDYLGNQLETLILNYYSKGVTTKSIPNWNITKNRMIFSIKNSKSEETKKPLMLEEKPLHNSTGKHVSNKEEKKEDKNSSNYISFKSNFLSFIFKKIDKKKIDELNESRFKVLLPVTLTDQNLLDLIEKNDSELYSLIEEWNKSPNRNRGLISELNVKISSLEGKLKNAKDESKHQELIKVFIEMNNQNFKASLFNLLIEVENIVLELEQNKKLFSNVLPRGGGTKKKGKNSSLFTRKLINKK
uniref:Uncharacterized protein n=1 Tax=viral metagenome TaxID=1070528 RepID=A0A6C0HSX8_9ZZZZ